ncbi:hypothetical protein [Elizabethkingia sp. JS20170427COW]|uniref:hypothetical protein n=1 Tax=Elizabethkingia sp. JS20170427COW TaxID=2583851 RepID=UPI00111049FF|nr:hypothetical protein [Elizabethkingia sp. JS20170427COW]QCX52677.1 hypothetical protein FGE20_02405 [Elizabethkingia sp. JS20170427COW]
MKNKLIIPALLLLVFNSCTENKSKPVAPAEEQNTLTAPETDAQPKSASVPVKEVTVVGDQVLIPEFKVKINLDSKIYNILKDDKESIIADYYFYGDVAEDAKLPADVQKHMDLYGLKLAAGKLEDTDIQKPEVIFDFKNISFPKKLYDALSIKDVRLNINFYSGRKAFENNILEIDAFDSSFQDIIKNNYELTYDGKLLDAKDFQGNSLIIKKK